ncbi:hypothetical protein GFV33_21525, partial [Salmonella enterica]|nr:hypothetical protein [Salmonella enterica]
FKLKVQYRVVKSRLRVNHPQLNREYGYDEGGRLVRISGPQQTREYRYSESGRLTGVHTRERTSEVCFLY